VKSNKAKSRNAKPNSKTKPQSAHQFTAGQHIVRRFETHERICEFIVVLCALLLGGMSAFSGHKLVILWITGIGLCAAIFTVLFWYTDRELTRTSAIVLKSPRFTERPRSFTIIAGDNRLDIAAEKEAQFPRLHTGGTQPFSAHLSPDNSICVDADVYAGSNRPAITVRDNVIVGKPQHWDRNSDDTAVEIVNERGDPVFQLEYLDKMTASLKGVFVSKGRFTVSDDTGALRFGMLPKGPITYSLARLFKYPSARFPGQREARKEEQVDKTLTRPVPAEIAKELGLGSSEFFLKPPTDKLAKMIGMKVKWRVLPWGGKGGDMLRFIPHGHGPMVEVALASVPEGTAIDDGMEYTISGTIESIEMGRIRLNPTAIVPIETKNVRTIP
jgi:hypothetical protein